jgi:hypothetical protein
LTITSNNGIKGRSSANGSIRVTFSGVTGKVFSSSEWSATMTLHCDELDYASASETIRVNGNMTLVANQASPSNGSSAASGASLQLSRTVSGTRLNQLALSDYWATATISSATINRHDGATGTPTERYHLEF